MIEPNVASVPENAQAPRTEEVIAEATVLNTPAPAPCPETAPPEPAPLPRAERSPAADLSRLFPSLHLVPFGRVARLDDEQLLDQRRQIEEQNEAQAERARAAARIREEREAEERRVNGEEL